MDRFLGLAPDSAEIYIPDGAHNAPHLSADRYVAEYTHWHLVLQPEEYRQKRGRAAGLIIAKRKVVLVTDLNADEWADIENVLRDGLARLCKKAGVTFTGNFVGPAFNNGALAGQSQAQVHGHLYPVIAEDLPAPGQPTGIGSMVEALREQQAR
jgi:diadenosine tetraphosphate (Ap4A) HIT family hydrolase